jgi:uncharacterized membrane protein YkvA (DUF1232 family)
MRLSALKDWAGTLRRQALAAYFAARDPRTPWPVRLLAMSVAAYAFSPIDLIPDFIPVLGQLDDLLLVPLGIALVLRLVPAEVMADASARAAVAADQPTSAAIVVAIAFAWLLALCWLGWWLHAIARR